MAADNPANKAKKIKKSSKDLSSKVSQEQLKILQKKSQELKKNLAKKQLEERIHQKKSSPLKVFFILALFSILVISLIRWNSGIQATINPKNIPLIGAAGQLAPTLNNLDFPIELTEVKDSHFAFVPDSPELDGTQEALSRQKNALQDFKLPLEVKNEFDMSFRLIPPGEFLMGSPEEETGRKDVEFQHLKKIKTPFYAGKYEITVDQWQKIVGKLPYNSTKIENNPVTGVSLDDCLRFVQALNKSLSSEAGFRYYLMSEIEWEYCARAGCTKAYSFGDLSVADDYVCHKNSTHTYNVEEVGSRRPNAWGLYDVHGNALEWTRTPFFLYACGEQQYAGINAQTAKEMQTDILESSWDTALYDGESPENLVAPLDKFDVPLRAFGTNVDISYHDSNNNDRYDKHEAIWKDHPDKGKLQHYDSEFDTMIVSYAKKVPEGQQGKNEGLFYYDKNQNIQWDPNEGLWARNDLARKHTINYVMRGGCFFFYAEDSRSAQRYVMERQNAPTYGGFRITIHIDEYNRRRK